MKRALLLPLLLISMLVCDSLPAADPPENWYTRSFFLLHLDHHTSDKMRVGRDVDPAETARLINLVKPDAIQIHAKGNPGWTTYPSKVGHTPPLLARDVMRVWADIARENHYSFSAYYNIGRDREIMLRHPEWNRVNSGGTPRDNALCYHAGVAEQYLWPMIDEIMERYQPGGFWFDGSCFTVANCYCAKCRERFRREHDLAAPAKAGQPGWAEFKEMHRRIYREFCAQTALRIKRRDPKCLVAINWAYSLRMPEEPPAGVDYFTGDHGTGLDDLAPDAIWYDSQGRPFDLMTALFYQGGTGPRLKPRWQLEQELGIIIAHGGRYFAWDTPTPESGLIPERYEMMAKVVAPFLRSRQAWCMNTRRLADVSLFHGAAGHYAQSAAAAVAFPRQNPPLLAACEGLRRMHLGVEMISDRRLEAGDIRGRVLLLEDTLALTTANQKALRRYVESGGRVLLTGAAVAASGLLDAQVVAGPVRKKVGQGEVIGLAHPLFASGDKPHNPAEVEKTLQEILPDAQRLATTDAAPTVELVLRERAGEKVLHLININPGKRERNPQVKSGMNLHVVELPPAAPCRVSLLIAQRPGRLMLQPQNKPLPEADWSWRDGRLHLALPAFETHQMVVIAER